MISISKPGRCAVARYDPPFTKVGHQQVEAAEFQILLKDGPDPLGFLFNHDDLAVLGGVFEGSTPSSRPVLRLRFIAQAEKPGAIPARASDREGDLGQAGVGLAVPGKPVSEHHDPLQVTIPLARQQGAGPQLGSGSVEVSDKPVGPVGSPRSDPVKQTPAVGIKVAEPIGLQPIGQDTKEQMAGQVRGCSPPGHRVPSGSQVPDIESAQTRDLVVERLSIRHRWIDHHACHSAQAARRRKRRELEPAPLLWTMR